LAATTSQPHAPSCLLPLASGIDRKHAPAAVRHAGAHQALRQHPREVHLPQPLPLTVLTPIITKTQNMEPHACACPCSCVAPWAASRACASTWGCGQPPIVHPHIHTRAPAAVRCPGPHQEPAPAPEGGGRPHVRVSLHRGVPAAAAEQHLCHAGRAAGGGGGLCAAGGRPSASQSVRLLLHGCAGMRGLLTPGVKARCCACVLACTVSACALRPAQTPHDNTSTVAQRGFCAPPCTTPQPACNAAQRFVTGKCRPMPHCAQVVEEVASSRVALQLLLDGQDYAGALDLLEVSLGQGSQTLLLLGQRTLVQVDACMRAASL